MTKPSSTTKPHTGHEPNRLIHETSPYLLQHAYNPVDWYPWSEEAIARAKAEDKPIFLSIGYSACHWCHVMERESFEDPQVGAYLKEHFISIKVDREERPDLDDLYMQAVQQISRSGGWPMTVFLTPDLRPFFGGTYFPPQAMQGRPSFMQVLEHFTRLWKEERQQVEDFANQVKDSLVMNFPKAPDSELPTVEQFKKLEAEWLASFSRAFDSVWGGFGSAPKFPRADDVRWLLTTSTRSNLPAGREMALFTLRKMADGGMYDQIAGGFARYSVDEKWLIPHFEKMLYDQGTLIPAYVDGWQASGEEFYAQIARECCDYLLREMRDPLGGFWSATDADSEGEEGKFFVWTPAQLKEVLGEERAAFAQAYWGVTEAGNFEHGTSALTRAQSAEDAVRIAGVQTEDPAAYAEEVRKALYEHRLTRVPPLTDDKIILAWNGLAIAALSYAGRALNEPRYTEAAAQAAEFLLKVMPTDAGFWHRTWRKGQAKHDAVLEDYAYFTRALLGLFQSTGEEKWLAAAEKMGQDMVRHYWDEETAVFWDTDGRAKDLLHRRKSPTDGATPSPNAVALECLQLLYSFTGNAEFLQTAEKGFASLLRFVSNNPQSFSATLRPLGWAVEEPHTAVVIGTGERASMEGWRLAIHAIGQPYVHTVFKPAAKPDSEVALFQHRDVIGKASTLYLCQDATCKAPTSNPADWPKLLKDT